MDRYLTKSAIAALSAATLMIAPASAGTKDDVRDLQARMTTVEQGVSAQSAAVAQMSALEREIQILTGQVEELSYRLELSNQRLNAISAVLAGDPAFEGISLDPTYAPGGAGPTPLGGPTNLTIGEPATGPVDPLGAVETPNTPVTTAEPDDAAPTDVTLPFDPNEAFDYASRYLLQGDYQRAKAAFILYVEAFPTHPHTPDARFRLGEIYLALRENAAAAEAFIGHIRDYPNDPRSPEAYLKLGTAFSRLDKPSEACTVFKTLKSKYPNTTATINQRRDLEMARIQCG
ncbi:MAG: tol-pal system protein YbgF [Pseudomonadota bacterium]